MICLIAAYAKNKVIGNKGHIPWSLPGDQQRFKEITLGGVLIMGRRTFEEIYKKFGGGLPQRETIVLSKNQNFEGKGFRTLPNLQAGLAFAKDHFPEKDLFICGGASVYREAIENQLVDKMYLTEIDFEPKGDVFFPDFDKNAFEIIKKQTINDIFQYTLTVYVKKNL